MKTKVLEYKGYQGSIETSVEDNVLHGKILHIVDLVTFEGQTPLELKQAFEEQVDEYLEFCREEGVAPDKPFKGTFNVRIGEENHKNLALAASRAGISLNDTVTRIINAWLDECPDGFSVKHHHTHEHLLVHEDTSADLYRGAVQLNDTNWRVETTIPTRVTMQ